MTQLTDKYWAAQVPSMAFGFDINNYADDSELIYMLSMSDIADDDNAEETLITKPLPPGTWQFLFTTKTATEEGARKVVEQYTLRGNIRYTDYAYEYMWCETALDSLRSLLRSKGLDEKNNYAIIEMLKDGEKTASNI